MTRKDDEGKLRYDLMPPWALEQVVEVLTYGAGHYSPNGWRLVPDAKARYTAALMRHLEKWRQENDIDGGTGLPHLAHVICNAIFLLELERAEVDKLPIQAGAL